MYLPFFSNEDRKTERQKDRKTERSQKFIFWGVREKYCKTYD